MEINIFIMIALIFILFLVFLSIRFYILANKKLKNATEYNESVSAFKHDFDNIITTIGGYIRTNDMAGLKDYYLELEKECQKINNLHLLNPDLIKNSGVHNLLTKKYEIADAKGIKMNFTFLLDFTTLKMKIYEFSRILGILLDNAIEASTECDDKIVNLSFKDDFKNHRQLITIENTYKEKNVDIDKIFKKGISGKDNHTGLGLWEVRKLVKKNSNVNLYTTKNSIFFIQQLEIYY